MKQKYLDRYVQMISAAKKQLRSNRSKEDRTNFKDAITKLMENAQSGEYNYIWFQERIFISRRQWSRIVKDIRDEHSLFAKKMMDAGVSYVSNGKGRGAKSYFEKLT